MPSNGFQNGHSAQRPGLRFTYTGKAVASASVANRPPPTQSLNQQSVRNTPVAMVNGEQETNPMHLSPNSHAAENEELEVATRNIRKEKTERLGGKGDCTSRNRDANCRASTCSQKPHILSIDQFICSFQSAFAAIGFFVRYPL
ncbi:hypothetical protein Q7P36_001233 [Cladosporium allicinum]